jgi:hypothetical protein
MHPTFLVELVKFKDPIGNVGHALLKCPRCGTGLGVTKAMIGGIDSIICEGMLGSTGFKCRGHYYYDLNTSKLTFHGTQDRPTKTFNPIPTVSLV